MGMDGNVIAITMSVFNTSELKKWRISNVYVIYIFYHELFKKPVIQKY